MTERLLPKRDLKRQHKAVLAEIRALCVEKGSMAAANATPEMQALLERQREIERKLTTLSEGQS